MKFEILYHPYFEKHESREYHPENPQRLKFIIDSLKEKRLWNNVVKPPLAKVEEVLEVHKKEYVERVRKAIELNLSHLDPDTYVSDGTWKSALAAFGASRDAMRRALTKNGLYFALVRPPGHHAGKSGIAFNAPTLGFCIFNNVAGAAKLAEKEGYRVVIIDFDVHHGNGTQEIFWEDPNVIHIDFHERNIYPGSGDIYDIGEGEAEGTKINIPLEHYSKDDDYIYAWNEIVEPILDEVKPKVIAVSAGFDAFNGDGLATMQLTERFYYFAGASLSKFSLAVVLEGGYSIGLRKGLPAFIEGYIDGKSEIEEISPSYETIRVVEKIKEIQSEWWKI